MPLVKLRDCPVGLFEFSGELCLKTEYNTLINGSHVKCDCYTVESGEYFTGGVRENQREDLLVEPVYAYDTRAIPEEQLDDYIAEQEE